MRRRDESQRARADPFVSGETGVTAALSRGKKSPRISAGASVARWIAAAIVLIAIATPASTLSAKVGAPVVLGRVSTKLRSQHWLKPPEFRRLVERELSQLDMTQVKTKDRFVLEATITKLETRTSADKTEATCVVSGMLTRKSGGAVRAILRGRARAQDGPTKTRAAERAAVEGAVHSALSRVGEALQ
jgi:hypothetical protein